MALPGWWHLHSFTAMMALVLAMQGWHWDGPDKTAPGLTSPGQRGLALLGW